MVKLNERHEKILRVLAALPAGTGYITKDIAERTPMFGHNRRIHSGCTRSRLDEMAPCGLVALLDNKKPDCWTITPAGRAALAEEKQDG